MNVNLPKKAQISVKAVIIYTVSIITCIIAVIIAGLSIYYGSDELDRLITIGGSSLTQSDEDYQLLVSNFDDIFQNQLEEYTTDISIKKIVDSQEVLKRLENYRFTRFKFSKEKFQSAKLGLKYYYKLIKITFGNKFYGRQNVIKFFIKLEEIIKNAF